METVARDMRKLFPARQIIIAADNDQHLADNIGLKAPRCLAKTRKGTECQSPAVRGRKRCRMHGGTNPGAPMGNQNAWKHGARSADTEWAKSFLKAGTRKFLFEA